MRGAETKIGLDLAQQRRAQQFGEVEPDAVDAEHFGPMTQRGVHESLEHRRLGADIVTAAAPVGESALRVDAVVIGRIDRTEAVGRAEMVQHDVHDDGEAGLMTRADEIAELLHRDDARSAGVGVRDAEGADGHVAPMIFVGRIMLELGARQQFDCVDAERAQVVALRSHIAGEVAITAGRRCAVGETEQVAQMAFEDHEILDRRRDEAVIERQQCFGTDHEARGLPRADHRAGPRVDDVRASETFAGVVLRRGDLQPVMGAAEILRPCSRPRALPFGLEHQRMRAAAGRMTPDDFDRAGARSEDAEQRRTRADRRAETARGLQDVQRLRGQDVAEFEQLRGLENHADRHGGRIDVGRMEAKDMSVGAPTGDDEVAVITLVATDVVGVVRRLDPAVALAPELEDGLIGFAEDFREVRGEFEAFGARHADRTQLPTLHVDGAAPVIEGSDHADGTLRGLRTERLPEKEMDAAALHPVPRTQGPGADVGRLEQGQPGRRVQRERRQPRTSPVARERDQPGDLRLPAGAGQFTRHRLKRKGGKINWRAKAGFPPGHRPPTMRAWISAY